MKQAAERVSARIAAALDEKYQATSKILTLDYSPDVKRPVSEEIMATIAIGKLAKSCGVNIDTIRYYERRELLFPVERTAAGYRKYSTDSIARLDFIRTSQGLGFTLKEIKGLLEITEDSSADCADIRAIARQKLAEIEPRIADLEKIKAALEELSEFCPGKGHELDDCTILRYFYGNGA